MTPVIEMDPKRRETIEAEARAWIVQLDGRAPSREDLAALREWASRSPLHYATLRELADLWGELDGLAELHAAMRETPPPAAAPANDDAARRARARGSIRAVAAAAGIALLVGGGMLFTDHLRLFPAENRAQEFYATAMGEQHSVTLPDGSVVQLNTNSLLEVDFERGQRRLRLVRGEALFDVEPDPARPFIVYADASSVRAVGTVFSVRMAPERLDVTVSEGVVELTARAARRDAAAGGTSILGARQTATLSGGDVTMRTIDERELERLMGWSQGVLVFEGERLGDVLAEFGRYTHLRFDVSDPELRDLRIGGRFQVGETSALLRALETGFGIYVTRENDRISLSRRD